MSGGSDSDPVVVLVVSMRASELEAAERRLADLTAVSPVSWDPEPMLVPLVSALARAPSGGGLFREDGSIDLNHAEHVLARVRASWELL